MKIKSLFTAAVLLLAQFLITLPIKAETELQSQNVVIHEIQTNGPGTGTTDQEFIEIKNLEQSSVDLSGWQLIYTPSTGNQASNKTIITFATGTLLEPDDVLVVSPSTFLVDLADKFNYTGSTNNILAATSGSVSLVNSFSDVVDLVGWGSASNITTLKEQSLMSAPDGGKSIQRKRIGGLVSDTNNNLVDFEQLDVPTPAIIDIDLPKLPEEPIDEEQPPIEEVNPDPNEPQTEQTEEEETPETTPNPVGTTTLLPISLNEIYVDPASPETDSRDEWVEIYNPNNEEVDISGYSIYSGTNNTYKYVFATGSKIAGGSYLIITSGESSLAFSNSGGAARLFDNQANLLDEAIYSDVQEGESWMKDTNGLWTWTSTPTRAAVNVYTLPLPPALKAAAKKVAKKKSTKKATKKKATKVKAAKKTKAKKTNSDFDDAALIAAPTPIPWWALAGILTLALLYVGYEYRFELANSFHRFKNYRINRR